MQIDVLIIGAGAAGLMCAATAGYRGKKVVVVDMGKSPDEKYLSAVAVVVISLMKMHYLKTIFVKILIS